MHMFESKNVCAYDRQINFDRFFVDFIGYRIMNHRSIFMNYIYYNYGLYLLVVTILLDFAITFHF